MEAAFVQTAVLLRAALLKASSQHKRSGESGANQCIGVRAEEKMARFLALPVLWPRRRSPLLRR